MFALFFKKLCYFSEKAVVLCNRSDDIFSFYYFAAKKGKTYFYGILKNIEEIK